ncbi:MAG: hypothetical protein WAK28_03250, partial [Trebonia sp.]
PWVGQQQRIPRTVQLEEPFGLFLLGCHGPKLPGPPARVDRLPPPGDIPAATEGTAMTCPLPGVRDELT